MQLAELAGRDVILLGVGKETLTVLPHLRAASVASVVMVEPGPIKPNQFAQLAAGGIDAADVADVVPPTGDIVLRSPGFPRHRDDVEALAAAASLMTTPTGLWIDVRGGARTITVTGTKGKSTTATLIRNGLVRAGVDATLAGNIGTSPWELDPNLADVVVVELSSYHGSDLISAGEITVLTMITTDHVDWHGSADRYRRDKLRILRATQADGSPQVHVFALPGENLPGNLIGTVERIDAHTDGIRGDYRHRNVALAAAAVNAELQLLGRTPINTAELREKLASDYPSLPGRFHLVGRHGNVDYIDDSLASNPTATAAALETLAPGPAVLICGGHDRAVPLDPVVDVLTRWPENSLSIVWLGSDEDPRYQVLASLPAIDQRLLARNMEDALIIASLSAPAGSTVLFSPLAPTERSEGTWVDRSTAFRKAFERLTIQH